ncbi:MAG: hypothetical protein M5U12_05275 [Verrucomicrobia bacterium]|nr:hypothetical protein [Verrucomicrobiota bacterium]
MNPRRTALLLTAILVMMIGLLWWLPESSSDDPTADPPSAPLLSPSEPQPGSAHLLVRRSPLDRARAAANDPQPNTPEGEPIDNNRLGDPAYRARLWRSRNTLVYLKSPIRNSPEIQQLAALCRTYGYGPWAVAAAYWLAHDNLVKEEMLRDWPEVPPDYRPVTEEIQEMLWQGRSQEYAQRLNVIAWDPLFIEEVRKVKPREFIGHHASEFMDDKVLIDAMTWEEVEQSSEGPGPQRRQP